MLSFGEDSGLSIGISRVCLLFFVDLLVNFFKFGVRRLWKP